MYSTPPNSKIIASPRDIDENNLYVYDSIIDDSIRTAYDTYMLTAVSDPRNYISSFLSKFGLNKYSSSAAIQYYYDKPYLYSLKKDGTPYTVEQFLNDEIPEEDLNNDLNYAEILTVFGQNEKYQDTFVSYSDFYDKFNDEENAKLFFEMEFEDAPTWFYWDENDEVVVCESEEDAKEKAQTIGSEVAEAEEENEDTDETDESEDDKTSLINGIATLLDHSKMRGYGYFYDVKVYPYGLAEIYELAEVEFGSPNLKASNLTNYEMLNYNEGALRTYLECTGKLGPSCYIERSYDSNIRDLMDEIGLEEPTGRTPLIWCYNSINRLNYDEMDSKSNDIVYVAEGEAVILKMPYYINQGDFKTDYRGTTNETIKDSGCCDCSYTMCAMYYDNYAYDIRQISKDYVLSSTSLDTSRFLKDFNMAETRCTDPSGFKADTIESLRQGNPVVLHIKGLWTNPETKYQYHKTTNVHFLVIMGYDDNGFYVYDPGSDSNTKLEGGIPYEMFFKDQELITDYRLITPTNSNVQKSFVINTLSGINEKASVNDVLNQ